MNNHRPDHGFGGLFISVLRDLFGWFAGVLGICLVAGGIGTGAGLYLGLPFTLALGCGLGAIVLVLGVYMFLASGGF